MLDYRLASLGSQIVFLRRVSVLVAVWNGNWKEPTIDCTSFEYWRKHGRYKVVLSSFNWVRGMHNERWIGKPRYFCTSADILDFQVLTCNEHCSDNRWWHWLIIQCLAKYITSILFKNEYGLVPFDLKRAAFEFHMKVWFYYFQFWVIVIFRGTHAGDNI